MQPIQAFKAAPCLTWALFFGFFSAEHSFAQGFSLSGFVSESLDFTENARLAAVSAGSTLTSSTSVGLTLLSETPVSSFELSTSTFLFVARNPDDSLAHELGFPTLSLKYNDTTATREFTFGATYEVAPAGDGRSFFVDDENDDGVVDPGEVHLLLTDARQIAAGINLGYSTELSPRDKIGVVARASMVNFDGTDPDLIPSTRQSLRVNWSHQITNSISGGATLGGSWFTNEAIVPVTSNITTLTGDISYEANDLLSFSANLGVSKVDVQEGATTSSSNSLSGGASVNYVLANGSIGADLGFGVRPSDGGALQQSVSLGAKYSQSINSESSFSASVDWSADGDVGGAFGSGPRSFSFSPVYNRQLARDINANVGYRYESVQGSSFAASHSVFLGLSKSFQFLK